MNEQRLKQDRIDTVKIIFRNLEDLKDELYNQAEGLDIYLEHLNKYEEFGLICGFKDYLNNYFNWVEKAKEQFYKQLK